MEICPITPHAISGIFWLGTTASPSEKKFCMQRKKSVPILFHGIIGVDEKDPYPDQEIMGEILDTYFGNSAVLNFQIDPLGNLSFERRLNCQTELMSFNFKKNNDSVFVGNWSIVDHDVIVSGVATCILTPLPKSFFEEPK